METPGGVEQEWGSWVDDFEVAFDVSPLLDLHWVSFTHLVDGGVGLLADSGGNDSRCYGEKTKLIRYNILSIPIVSQPFTVVILLYTNFPD